MAAPIVKALDQAGENYEGKVITDFIPLRFSGYYLKDDSNPHSKPCPSDVHGMNEWVLNHLPLGHEEQKKKIRDELMKEQNIESSRKKREDKIKKIKETSILTRTSSEPIRRSVKTTTKEKS